MNHQNEKNIHNYYSSILINLEVYISNSSNLAYLYCNMRFSEPQTDMSTVKDQGSQFIEYTKIDIRLIFRQFLMFLFTLPYM